MIGGNAQRKAPSSGDADARGSVRRAPVSRGTACHSAISPHPARKCRNNSDSSLRFDVWEGGSKIIITPETAVGTQKHKRRAVPKRGKIREMSKASAKRLRRKLAEVRAETCAYTFCLSYPQWFPSPERAQKDLQKLGRWVDRHHPEKGMFWKREPQERGATHYHLLVFGGDDFDSELAVGHSIARKWCEISSQGLSDDMREKQLRVHLFQHKHKPWKSNFQRMRGKSFFNYLGKYISKYGQSYPEGYGASGGCGWWGYWNKSVIPWAEQKTKVLELPTRRRKQFMRVMYRLREHELQKQLDNLSQVGSNPRLARDLFAAIIYKQERCNGVTMRDCIKYSTKVHFRYSGSRRSVKASIKVKPFSHFGSVTFLGNPDKYIAVAQRYFSKRIDKEGRARVFGNNYVPPATGGQEARCESGESRVTKSAI